MRFFAASVRSFGGFLALGVALACGACNSVGTCPAPGTITNGVSCSGDTLECPYTLQTPSPACDGTSTQLATSCVCTQGAWACPDPVDCGDGGDIDSGGGDDSGDGGGEDASSTDAAGGG
jgi:hypothetical protein